ncbi:MAG: serine/threonine-protein kinase [Clostridia bacterium]|nr:serine/threonine-protein kinase [Clostridia bacterium]
MTIEQVWPEWNVDRVLGKGSYGTVYRCSKTGGSGGTEYAAVKVISVPQDDYDAEYVGSEWMTVEQSRAYYKDIADQFMNEIRLLEALKNEPHIVNILDSAIVEKEEGIGWQIFIRMELLTDFNTYSSDKNFTPEDVRKIALDLCDALIVCGKKRIVHRDIKPENIFVDDKGNFKLGDFGVAKQMEKTYASMSTKGTYNFMAPEVVTAQKYDSRADIYSLGIVMYKLLNNNRLPFLDPEKQLIRFHERQEAFERRIKGEKIPPIPGVDDDMNAVILKACGFRPEDRYRNVEEFRQALVAVTQKKQTVKTGKKRNMLIPVLCVIALIAVTGSILTGIFMRSDKEGPSAATEKTATEEHRLDVSDLSFEIFGYTYRYPYSVDDFLDNNWTCDIPLEDEEITPDTVFPIILEQRGARIEFTIANDSDETCRINEGVIRTVSISVTSGTDYKTARGLTGAGGLSDIERLYGVPDEEIDASLRYTNEDLRCEIIFTKTDGGLQIYYGTPAALWGSDISVEDEGRQYLDASDMNFELLGHSYTYPCSLDDFLENHWETDLSVLEETLEPNAGFCFTLQQEDASVFVSMDNHSEQKAKVKDCDITVLSVKVSRSTDFRTARGISGTTDESEIISCYGSPHWQENRSYGYSGNGIRYNADRSYITDETGFFFDIYFTLLKDGLEVYYGFPENWVTSAEEEAA